MAVYAGHFDLTKPLLGSVPGLYAPDECAEILASLENAEWLSATVNSETGRVVDATIRDSATAIVRDEQRASTLTARIMSHVPPRMTTEDPRTGERVEMTAVGVFKPLRVYRYQPGQHFGLHQDHAYGGPLGARSLLTLMVYLNDDFDGGETEFPDQNRSILPRCGAALWFQHALLHAGHRVRRGTKYVLRTDVLYRSEP